MGLRGDPWGFKDLQVCSRSFQQVSAAFQEVSGGFSVIARDIRGIPVDFGSFRGFHGFHFRSGHFRNCFEIHEKLYVQN